MQDFGIQWVAKMEVFAQKNDIFLQKKAQNRQFLLLKNCW